MGWAVRWNLNYLTWEEGEPFRDGKMDDVMLSKQLFIIWYGLCEIISGISCCS